MRMIMVAVAISLFLSFAGLSQVEAARTKGFFKKNGSYVQPYYRSSPNRYKSDNYSSWGNINPYSGKKGYKKW